MLERLVGVRFQKLPDRFIHPSSFPVGHRVIKTGFPIALVW